METFRIHGPCLTEPDLNSPTAPNDQQRHGLWSGTIVEQLADVIKYTPSDPTRQSRHEEQLVEELLESLGVGPKRKQAIADCRFGIRAAIQTSPAAVGGVWITVISGVRTFDHRSRLLSGPVDPFQR